MASGHIFLTEYPANEKELPFDNSLSCMVLFVFYFWFLYRTPNSLCTQDSQFAFRLLFFVEDLEVRVNLADAHVTSLVVLQNFKELTRQHDDYEQIYVGR